MKDRRNGPGDDYDTTKAGEWNNCFWTNREDLKPTWRGNKMINKAIMGGEGIKEENVNREYKLERE